MRTIGIIGGVGPLAGVDLHQKIILHTEGATDQEHLSVIHLSFSSQIEDRTRFLLQPEKFQNPAYAVCLLIEKIYAAGAEIIGIPCNTFHTPKIFSIVESFTQSQFGDRIELLHLVKIVANEIQKYQRDQADIRVGLLATTGTYQFRVYEEILESMGMRLIVPETLKEQEEVHSSIYDPQYGLKANSRQDNLYAKEILLRAATQLMNRGADLLILGCTEIPLVLNQEQVDFPLLDPTTLLAKALVSRAVAK